MKKTHKFTIMTIEPMKVKKKGLKRPIYFTYHELSGFKFLTDRGKEHKKPPKWAIEYANAWLNTVCEFPSYLWDNENTPLTFKKENKCT